MTSRLASYELLRKIAAGGMAEIFLARQWGEGGFFRDVVIKRLFPHLAEHERQLRMFQDEGRLLSQLAHPNIPQAYDVGFADGYWYIAMEHVEGLTVADLWRLGAKGGQVMPMNVSLAILAQACEALHHAHERSDRAGHPLRIVHRDVTPQNIMVTRDGVVKLMDFGVAQTSARKDTEAGAVRGTFSYMAPEQVRGRPLDKRADVFALGVVLYELTTGTRLFRGTDVQIMTQVVEHDVTPPSALVPGYPPDLEEIVLTALSRERAARMPSAAHLTIYLEELAIRSGLSIGPRAIARYFTSAAPADPVLEASLGMVEPDASLRSRPRLVVVPDSEARRIWGPDDESLPDIDEDEVLDDLRLLSIPADPIDPHLPDVHVPSAISMPGPDDSRPGYDLGRLGAANMGWSEEHIGLDSDVHDLDDLLGQDTDGAPTLSLDDASSLVLDGFSEEGSKENRPVVLLDDSARKGAARKGGSKRLDAADYVNELERRLAREDEDV